jgi:hypothetical protein
MELKVGSSVRFLNDVGGGVVTKILDKQKVMVLTHDGFEVPSGIKELVVIAEPDNYKMDEPNAKQAKEVPQKTKTEKINPEKLFFPDFDFDFTNGDKLDLLLAFYKQGKANADNLEVYLINNSNYHTFYNLVRKGTDGKATQYATGVLEANTKNKIGHVTPDSFNTAPEFVVQAVFYQKNQYKLHEPASVTLKINPVKLLKDNAYKENDFFQDRALILPVVGETSQRETLKAISDVDIKKALLQKDKNITNIAPVKTVKPDKLEIDLHIQALVDDFKGLSNGEILELQMERFKSELKQAMAQGPKKLVFIHGVGNGVLKLEIRKELDRLFKKLTYQDASFKEYGYGATLVKLF